MGNWKQTENKKNKIKSQKKVEKELRKNKSANDTRRFTKLSAVAISLGHCNDVIALILYISVGRIGR